MKQIKPIILAIISLGTSSLTGVMAQNPGDYSFYASSESYSYLTDGIAAKSPTNNSFYGDEERSINDLGFEFNFCGTTYTKTCASTNMWMSFITPTDPGSHEYFDNTSVYANDVNKISPCLMPFFDDMHGWSPGSGSYKRTGRGRNRVFTFEWKNWGYYHTSTADNAISAQVKIYEYGAIEYIYLVETNGIPSSADGATIGFALSTTSGDYNVLTNSSSSPGTTTTNFVTNIMTRPATGQRYMWFPKSGTNNTGALDIVSPPATFCAGYQDVKVRIMNFGKNRVNGVKVYWEVDGIAKTPVTYNGTIDTFGSSSGHTAVVTLGNLLFNKPHTIKVYTVEPNNSTDIDNKNDTLVQVVGPSPNAEVIASGPTIFCTAGAINVTLDAQPGVNNNYQWFRDGQPIPGATNPSYTATLAGDYTVKVDSNGCTNTSEVIKVQNQAMPMPIVTPNGYPSLCDSVTLTANAGVTGAFYQWQHQGVDIPGATNASYTATAQGNYTVITSRFSCKATSAGVNLVQKNKPSPEIEKNSKGDLLTSTTYQSYQWYFNGNIIPGATLFAYTPTKNGSYTVEVSNGTCIGLSDPIIVNGLSVGNVANHTNNISIYPNPASSVLYIDAKDGVDISISSIEGRMVKTTTLTNGNISISDLPSGMYVIKISSTDGDLLSTNKFIKAE